jgi:effector-binding domain-containing protein
MLSEPRIEQRPAHHYVAIPAQAPMTELSGVLDRLFPEIFGWVAEHGITPDGPPFIRYLVTDMDRSLEFEVGLPTAGPTDGDGRVQSGHLPAGRYVTALHTGPYDRLVDATAQLLAWADKNQVTWDTSRRGDQEGWRARLEYYPTDPQEEPNPEKWDTILAFLTKS